MHQSHAEALQRPDHIEQNREAQLHALLKLAQGTDEAHQDQAEEGDDKAGRDRPLAADLIGNKAGDGKAHHGGEAADDDHGVGVLGAGIQEVDHVVADVGAQGIVRHEPQKLCRQDGQQHVPVGLGHGLVIVDGTCHGSQLLAQGDLILQLLGQLILLDGLEEHQSRDDHQRGGDEEGQLDDPEVAGSGLGGVDVLAEHKDHAQNRGEGAAEVAHDVDDAVGLGPQGLGGDVRHESYGRVAVHHHEDQHSDHGDDHAHDVLVVEEQGDEGEGHGGDQGADQNVGHPLADGGVGLVGEAAEDGQQDQSGQVIAGHDDADDPLYVQNLFRVAELQLRGGHAVNPVGKNVRQEGGAPGVIDLPQQQDAKEGEADESRAPVVELQTAVGGGGCGLFAFEHTNLPFSFLILIPDRKL